MVEYTKIQKAFRWINIICFIALTLFLVYILWASGYLETNGFMYVVRLIFKLANVGLLLSLLLLGINTFYKNRYIIPLSLIAVFSFIFHMLY